MLLSRPLFALLLLSLFVVEGRRGEEEVEEEVEEGPETTLFCAVAMLAAYATGSPEEGTCVLGKGTVG